MIPFIRPSPPRLSELGDELQRIERSGIFSNYGPTNQRFEQQLQTDLFGDGGGCVTVCNATIGLMLAMRAVIERATGGNARPRDHRERRYALMPSFTFAAAAHAADWVGLTPLFCDIDETDWAASETAELELIAQYGDAIAVIVPYATFGNCIDLDRYERLSASTGIPVVVDAAASLGSLDAGGAAFGAHCRLPVVFSMQATKPFSTAEGGVIHSADPELVETLRAMGNFGFGAARSATMPGLNAKLSEVGALLALTQLQTYASSIDHREILAEAYRTLLPGWLFQEMHGQRCAHQFMPVLIPQEIDSARETIVESLTALGIGTGRYFSPHVAVQPFFETIGVAHDLSVTERIAGRILCLPLWNDMTLEMVGFVCESLRTICRPFVPRLGSLPDLVATAALPQTQAASAESVHSS